MGGECVMSIQPFRNVLNSVSSPEECFFYSIIVVVATIRCTKQFGLSSVVFSFHSTTELFLLLSCNVVLANRMFGGISASSVVCCYHSHRQQI